MSESALRVRVDPKLRREFIAACQAQDQTASQVLRAFMRKYLEEYHESRQRSLFPEPPK